MKLIALVFCFLSCGISHADAGKFNADMQTAFGRCDALYASVNLTPLLGKIPTASTSERSFSMLVSEELATPAERPAIEALAAVHDGCRQLYAKVHEDHGLLAASIAIYRLSSQSQVLFAELHRGAATYGAVNRALKQIGSEAEAAIFADYARADQVAAANRQQEAQAPSATGIFLQEMGRQLQRPSPTTTNCQRVGFQVQCTTR
jgi:hypothetical protein